MSKNQVVSLLIITVFALGLSTMFSQTVEDRITSILNRMTTAEKIKQLHHEGGFNTADNTRLNIPGFIMADGPHGVRDGSATSFPVTIGMASTWDVELVQRVGVALGKEFRGKGKYQALGPSMDLDRDPRNGRSPETGGEDPFLCGQITSSLIKGIQSAGCIATAKHYNANHRENGRETNNITISQRLLMDQAGLQFRTAVQEGGAFSVMNAYNLVNGVKCAHNPNLLTNILRTSWGFPFYVVSDWGAVWNAENAIEAGTDICMGSDQYQNDLPLLVASGAVPMSVLDEAVRRVLRTKALAGMLDYLPPGNPADINSVEHQQLCLEAGRKSIVLLKNEGNILPLNPVTTVTVAVIGPNAPVAPIDGSGSSYVTPVYSVTPLQGVTRILGGSRVRYAKGCDINSTDTIGFAAAVTAVTGADVVLFFGGLDPSQEGEGFDRVGGSIDLPGKQQDLINRIAAINPRIVASIFSGGICGLSRSINNIRGLLYGFYPGQEVGNAIAEVIFGVYNPGGKLPVTMPVSTTQLPAWNDNLNDDYGGGYRWFDAQSLTPQFAFGFGLSYTTFAYNSFVISPPSAPVGQPVNVSVNVTNTGSRIGDEVVQLYLTKEYFPVMMKELKAFQRVTLNPGETQTVHFTITPEQLYTYSETNARYEAKVGSYPIKVGGSSDNLPLSGSLDFTNAIAKPDLRILKIWTVPPFPVRGDTVVFLASVKNEGTGSSPVGISVNVSFKVNGALLNYSDEFSQSIPAGGIALICSNRGVAGSNRWVADSLGVFNIECTVDPSNVIDETREDNNSLTSEGRVLLSPPLNLALRKTVNVSSIEGPGYVGPNAVDGNMGTRWSSAFSDPQSITVDLGGVYHVSEILLYWETAYARGYVLMTSIDGSSYNLVYTEPAGDGGIDVIPLSLDARYLRLIGYQRATTYGYSLYEFQVHGGTSTAVSLATENRPKQSALLGNYPNPFNPSTTIRFDLSHSTHVMLEIFSLLGQQVATLVNEELPPGNYTKLWNASGTTSGVYFYRLRTGDYVATKKLTLLR